MLEEVVVVMAMEAVMVVVGDNVAMLYGSINMWKSIACLYNGNIQLYWHLREPN